MFTSTKLPLTSWFLAIYLISQAKTGLSALALKRQALPQLKWVNTVLGKLKTTLSGANKASGYEKYSHRYLGAFAYQFNRRFDLADLALRLIVGVCRGQPTPRRAIRQAEHFF